MSGTMKFTDSPEQAAVVQAPSYADVVVVAGAGSGKTYTMTRRIITLIEQGVSPEKILGLTFTRKAASELLSRVSAAVTRDQRERGLKSANMTFLKPEVSTYDAFFQSIVRQYGLLVGFDQNTQPLSEAGAMQLIHTVLDRHMDDLMAFDGDLKSFNTIAGNVFALSNAISGAMIGGDCTSFDEAVQRVRDWDEAFVEQIAKALDGETVPTEEPKSPKLPKRLKKGFRRGLRKETGEIPRTRARHVRVQQRATRIRRQSNATCCSILCLIIMPKNAPAIWRNSAISPSRHSSLSPDSRLSERPTANVIRMCSSTNTKTRPPRRRHC